MGGWVFSVKFYLVPKLSTHIVLIKLDNWITVISSAWQVDHFEFNVDFFFLITGFEFYTLGHALIFFPALSSTEDTQKTILMT